MQSPHPSPESNEPKKKTKLSAKSAFLAIIVLVLAFLGFEYNNVRQAKAHLSSAISAFESGDCLMLEEAYERSWDYRGNLVILSSMVETPDGFWDKDRFCSDFNQGANAQASGNIHRALSTYLEIYSDFDFSGSSRDRSEIEKLVKGKIDHQMDKLFANQPVETIADVDNCELVSQLQERSLIPNVDTNLPNLYWHCGQQFHEIERYGEAATLYSRILQHYPKHALAEQAESAAADAFLAEATEIGTDDLGQIEQIGTREQDTAVIIRNASPYRISVAFQGIEAKFGEIEPCRGCETSSVSCYEDRLPFQVFVVPAGTYNVALKIMERNVARPLFSTWTLKTGSEYGTCFYINQF